jgi:hypothetical protein
MPDGTLVRDIADSFGEHRQRRGRSRNMPSMPAEALVKLPEGDKELTDFARQMIEICRSGVGQRLEYYRFLNLITEAGRKDGTKSLVNLMYTVLDRLASHLFSPTDIRFGVDFESAYDKVTEARAARVARLMEHSWRGTKTGILFAKGVFEALKYGLMVMKQTCHQVGEHKLPMYKSSLIRPWQIGVYRPDIANLDEQPAIVETVPLTLPEVWRRIWMLPNARQLYAQIEATAAPGGGSEVANNFNHPVLISNQIQFSQPLRPLSGGVVGINSATSFSGLRADIAAPSVLFHEIWVWDELDYTTIQMIQGPAGGGGDILIAPRLKKSNLLVGGNQNSGLHPYTMIQPNSVDANIWGRAELADLYELQDWLSVTSDDIKKMAGLQIDKILAFTGDGLTDVEYGNSKNAGYMNLGPGGQVNDLTPAFNTAIVALVDKIIQLIEMINGFDNLLSGKGEPGVRSQAQASPMMKTAGARLKDRSLEVEEQCADAADLRLSLMEYKDGRNYWTDPEKIEESTFLLSDLPDDRRVVVDGHTTSPVFAEDHAALMTNGLKLGVVDKESYIDHMPFPDKDRLIARIHAAEKKQAELMEELKQQDPQGFAKAVEKSLAGGRRH